MGRPRPRTVALFPEDRCGEHDDPDVVQIRLEQLWNCAGRGSGARAGWPVHSGEQLGLDRFWAQRLPPSRKGTRWDQVTANRWLLTG